MMTDVVQTLVMNGSAALGAKQRLIVAVFASFSRCTAVLARLTHARKRHTAMNIAVAVATIVAVYRYCGKIL